MQIETISTKFALTHPGGNITASSFTNPTPQATKPSGDGILEFGAGGSIASNALILVPFGVGSNGNTFAINVFAWRETLGAKGGVIWVPMLLVSMTTCTLDSNVPGVANTEVSASNLFCNAITLTAGTQGTNVDVLSAGSGLISHALIDVKGARFVGVYYSTGSSATSCNGLWAKL